LLRSAFCVLMPSVFDATAAQAEARQPDPDRAVPPCVGKVLGLVRTLIAYGQEPRIPPRRPTDRPHPLEYQWLIVSYGIP
jgi:hypothetical protein